MLVNVCPDDISWTKNILSPSLVGLCSIISQCVIQKNWFTVFNVKVTVRAYIIKVWLFLVYLLHWWLVCNQIWFYGVAYKQECPVQKWEYCIQGQGHREGSKCWWIFGQMIFSLCVWSCPLSISWTVQPFFFSKLGMVAYYHEAMCHAETFVHYLQCQGHSKGLYNQHITVFIISSKLLVHWQTNLVW